MSFSWGNTKIGWLLKLWTDRRTLGDGDLRLHVHVVHPLASFSNPKGQLPGGGGAQGRGRHITEDE